MKNEPEDCSITNKKREFIYIYRCNGGQDGGAVGTKESKYIKRKVTSHK